MLNRFHCFKYLHYTKNKLYLIQDLLFVKSFTRKKQQLPNKLCQYDRINLKIKSATYTQLPQAVYNVN